MVPQGTDGPTRPSPSSEGSSLSAAAASSAAPPSSADETLVWPPPGLGRIIGDVYGAIGWLGAGAFLILPLLWAIVVDQGPWSMGPLGSTVWLAYLLAIVGIPIVVGGYVVLARLLRRSAEALAEGYQPRVVALVATDHRQDTGFLLQGDREYRVLSEPTRRRLATNRILVGLLLLFAALWISLGFGASVVLAARGVLGPWGVVLLTATPSVVAGVIAVIAYAWEEGILRKCRKRWYGQASSRERIREEIRSWQERMSTRAPGVVAPDRIPEGGGRARTAVRGSYVLLGAATVVAFVPIFTLVLSTAFIPVLARISVPGYDDAVTRFAEAEPLRAFALPPDTSISAGEAGEILHTLSFVGRPYRATEGVLPPPRSYEAPWFPVLDTTAATDTTVTAGPPPLVEWARSIVDDMGRPLPPERLAYLERVAAHPAHGELARLARSAALDISSARWSLPLPSDVTLDELGMPTTGTVRDGAYAHLARAAVQASRGDAAAADTTIREVLTVGLLMADESPAILDNLIGLALVDLAGDALEALYRNTGHGDAAALAWGREAAARSVERADGTALEDVSVRLAALPRSALDTALVRGLRWEHVALLNTVGPCMNLQRVVFGPDPEYRRWLEEARSTLVRYPAEEELFRVARGGLLGQDTDEAPGLSTRLLALTMGHADRPGSCARVLGEAAGF